jgi:hypothetical protein
MEEESTRALVEAYIDGEDRIFELYHYIQRLRVEEAAARRMLRLTRAEMDAFDKRMRTDQARKITTKAELESQRDAILAMSAERARSTEDKKRSVEVWTEHMRRVLDMALTSGFRFTSPLVERARRRALGLEEERAIIGAGAARVAHSRATGRRGSTLLGQKDIARARRSAQKVETLEKEKKRLLRERGQKGRVAVFGAKMGTLSNCVDEESILEGKAPEIFPDNDTSVQKPPSQKSFLEAFRAEFPGCFTNESEKEPNPAALAGPIAFPGESLGEADLEAPVVEGYDFSLAKRERAATDLRKADMDDPSAVLWNAEAANSASVTEILQRIGSALEVRGIMPRASGNLLDHFSSASMYLLHGLTAHQFCSFRAL